MGVATSLAADNCQSQCCAEDGDDSDIHHRGRHPSKNYDSYLEEAEDDKQLFGGSSASSSAPTPALGGLAYARTNSNGIDRPLIPQMIGGSFLPTSPSRPSIVGQPPKTMVMKNPDGSNLEIDSFHKPSRQRLRNEENGAREGGRWRLSEEEREAKKEGALPQSAKAPVRFRDNTKGSGTPMIGRMSSRVGNDDIPRSQSAVTTSTGPSFVAGLRSDVNASFTTITHSVSPGPGTPPMPVPGLHPISPGTPAMPSPHLYKEPPRFTSVTSVTRAVSPSRMTSAVTRPGSPTRMTSAGSATRRISTASPATEPPSRMTSNRTASHGTPSRQASTASGLTTSQQQFIESVRTATPAKSTPFQNLSSKLEGESSF